MKPELNAIDAKKCFNLNYKLKVLILKMYMISGVPQRFIPIWRN